MITKFSDGETPAFPAGRYANSDGDRQAPAFINRTQAGQLLSKNFSAYANQEDIIVLALPRGGVPVAFEVAKSLNAPLDVCLVRKIGVPGHRELAMGAIASQDIRVLNYDVINILGINEETIKEVASQELVELQRRDRAYRGNLPPLDVQNKTVILIDDGIATGSTMRAAIAILRKQQPKKIIVGVPVAPPITYERLQSEVDEIVCLLAPPLMSAIGVWYEDFSQTTDEEVRELLAQAGKMQRGR